MIVIDDKFQCPYCGQRELVTWRRGLHFDHLMKCYAKEYAKEEAQTCEKETWCPSDMTPEFMEYTNKVHAESEKGTCFLCAENPPYNVRLRTEQPHMLRTLHKFIHTKLGKS